MLNPRFSRRTSERRVRWELACFGLALLLTSGCASFSTYEEGDANVREFESNVTAGGSLPAIPDLPASGIPAPEFDLVEHPEPKEDRVGVVDEPPVPVRVPPTTPELSPSIEEDLLAAVLAERSEIVRQALQRGTSPNARDADGNTALHLAAARGYNRIVALLLSGGSDVNARNRDRDTPLHFAARTDRELTIRLLVEAGADRQAQNFSGETPAQILAADQVDAESDVADLPTADTIRGASESHTEVTLPWVVPWILVLAILILVVMVVVEVALPQRFEGKLKEAYAYRLLLAVAPVLLLAAFPRMGILSYIELNGAEKSGRTAGSEPEPATRNVGVIPDVVPDVKFRFGGTMGVFVVMIWLLFPERFRRDKPTDEPAPTPRPDGP